MKKLKERKLLQAIQEGMDDIKTGRVSEGSEVFARLRNRLNSSHTSTSSVRTDLFSTYRSP